MRDSLNALKGALLTNWSSRESDARAQWLWALGEQARIRLLEARAVRISFRIPAAGTEVSIYSGDILLGERTTSYGWEEWRQEWDGCGELVIRVNYWNGKGGVKFAADERELSVVVFEFLSVEQGDTLGPTPLENRICIYPFARMETNPSSFSPCCRWYLKKDYDRFEAGRDPWNGPAAQALRRTILDGSYAYCDRRLCGAPLYERDQLAGAKPTLANLTVSDENIAAIRQNEVLMPGGPTAITFTSDPRCNLACPSCRPEKIVDITKAERADLDRLEVNLERWRKSLRKLLFATNGEVFFSPWLRNQLRLATPDLYPCLEFVEILSNGILFDQEALDSLRPGTDWIRRVSISMDAGDEETYANVRGGDWRRLMKNIAWMSKLRAQGRFSWMSLQFVVRKTNWRSLGDFFSIAERFGVDEVKVFHLQKWDLMRVDFEAESLTSPGNTDGEAFRKYWADLRSRHRHLLVAQNLD